MQRILNRHALAWSSYDFANSTFSTSVLGVIFSVYFARSVVPPAGVTIGAWDIPGESLWGYLVSLAMAFVLVVAPPLGARADRRGSKRFNLMVWALVGSLATMSMFGATPGRLVYASLVTLIAIVGFEMSLVFYNAFLNDVADENERGRVSGLGFAFGYIGGGLCLAFNLAMLSRPGWFGLASPDPTLPVRASVFVAGLWWLIFSIPCLLTIRDRPIHSPVGTLGPFAQMRETIRHLRRYPHAARFLLAYLIYDDGVQTVILMASIFGAKALGMPTSELAACYLMIQFVAFVGALVAGRLADAVGHKKVVVTTLAAFLGVCLWGSVIGSPREFWMLGVVVGVVLGGAQAASRSLFSVLVPTERSGEFFALFSVVGKAAAIVGPFVFGVVAQAAGLRPAVLAIGAFFVVGGLLLLTVDERTGSRDAIR